MGMWERECKIESVGVLQDEACHIPASATGIVGAGMPCGGVTRHVECRQGVGHKQEHKGERDGSGGRGMGVDEEEGTMRFELPCWQPELHTGRTSGNAAGRLPYWDNAAAAS